MTPAPHCTARRHGDVSAYRYQCRCPEAREDKRLYHKHARHGRPYRRRPDATGTRRRIQALNAIGHTNTTIATTAGVHPVLIQRLANGNQPTVYQHTRTAITNAYLALRNQPGTCQRARRRATRNNWPTPTEWDAFGPEWIDTPDPTPNPTIIDHIAIQMVIDRQRPIDILTPTEQAALYRRLSPTLTDGQIRHRLGLSAAQVARAARAANTERTPT